MGAGGEVVVVVVDAAVVDVEEGAAVVVVAGAVETVRTTVAGVWMVVGDPEEELCAVVGGEPLTGRLAAGWIAFFDSWTTG